jgi:hypothetical protein
VTGAACAQGLTLDFTAQLPASLSGPEAIEPGQPAPPDLASQLQNPIADLISLPVQFNWDTGIGQKGADQLKVNIQPVIPISLNDQWNAISRTIVPVVYADSPADGVSSDFGLGDTLQSVFFSPKDPIRGWIVGAGPVLQIPTGTGDLFRTQQFSMGPTGIVLRQDPLAGGTLTSGLLANHLWRVAGSDGEVPDVNATFLQPFLAYTFGKGTTVGINAESTYDWQAGQWSVPINVTIAQLLTLGDQTVQLQFGGRYYVESPDRGPEWGLRFMISFLFPQ